MKEIMLALSKEIMADFEKEIMPEMPGYYKGWRYKELQLVINELESGIVKDHPKISYFVGMGGDELVDNPFLMVKLSVLEQLLQATKKYA